MSIVPDETSREELMKPAIAECQGNLGQIHDISLVSRF